MAAMDCPSTLAASASATDCGAPPADETPALDVLQAKGLEKYAEKILELSDAQTVADLKMMDAAMVEEVVKAADMKLIGAKKLRLVISELRREQPHPSTPMAPSPEAATTDSPEEGGPAAPPQEGVVPAAPPATATASGGPTDDAAGLPGTARAAQEGGVVPQLLGWVRRLAAFLPVQSTALAPQQGTALPQECVVVCVDRSGSMGNLFLEASINVVEGESKQPVLQRSRMEAVKAMFYAFRDRVDCMDDVHFQLGLVQFNDKVTRLLDLTPKLDLFEQIIDDMQKGGGTAIYDAIAWAARMLKAHFGEDSQTDLRILVLTDGQNTTGRPPEEALQAVNDVGAVVDAIIVGDHPDNNLRKIVSATEGECWQINDLGEGFELLEAESAVSLRARRGGADRPKFQRRDAAEFSSLNMKSMTKGSAVQRAPVLAEALAQKKVVDLGAATKTAEEAVSQGKCGGPVIKRVLKELKDVEGGGGGAVNGIHIFPSEDDITFWRVLMEGPTGSPFLGGVFLLNVIFPHDYPVKPPKIKFETPIYHCNVNDSGSLCLDILKDSWSPALTVYKALMSIRSLLTDPNPDDALRAWIAEVTLAHARSSGADTRYFDNAREATQKHASRTVDEWKQTWGF